MMMMMMMMSSDMRSVPDRDRKFWILDHKDL